MSKPFKPMLAVDCGEVDSLRFPLLASPKLDGVRAIMDAKGLLSRSLKLIPNAQVQRAMTGLPIGLDGELIAGDPCAPDAYRRTVSMVMSEDAPIDGLRYYIFDSIGPDQSEPFSKRLARAHSSWARFREPLLFRVPHILIENVPDLLAYEADLVARGYEGVMLRDPDGPYKYGRSTRKEGYLLKLKRFADSEAEVIGVKELMHNGNEAKTNALGRTERSSHKAGKVGMGVLGALVARDVKSGVEFDIGSGFTAAERAALWILGTGAVIGRLAKYKYFAGGSKDKPRFPVFLGWRAAIDR